MTLPNGCEMIPPAFFIILTSPFFIPNAATSNSVRRVSIQESMAIFLSGYLLVINFSYPLLATNSLLNFKISLIIDYYYLKQINHKKNINII